MKDQSRGNLSLGRSTHEASWIDPRGHQQGVGHRQKGFAN